MCAYTKIRRMCVLSVRCGGAKVAAGNAVPRHRAWSLAVLWPLCLGPQCVAVGPWCQYLVVIGDRRQCMVWYVAASAGVSSSCGTADGHGSRAVAGSTCGVVWYGAWYGMHSVWYGMVW